MQIICKRRCLLDRPVKPGDAPVTALAWSTDGALLAFGTEAGEAGIVDLK